MISSRDTNSGLEHTVFRHKIWDEKKNSIIALVDMVPTIVIAHHFFVLNGTKMSYFYDCENCHLVVYVTCYRCYRLSDTMYYQNIRPFCQQMLVINKLVSFKV